MSPALLAWLAGAMAVFLAASVALRSYAGAGGGVLLLAALALYTLGNLMMVRLMRESGLAVAISLSSVLQLVLISAIAVIWFGERPTGLQLAGIGLGVVAVGLIAWPQGGAR